MAHRGARIAAEAADLEARIEAIVPAFEAWLANEKRGSADTSKLDPLALVKHYISPGERKLREEVAGLSSALAHAKGVEEELEAAKTEITRFNEELTGRNEELDRFQKESASSYTAAKTEIARLTEELSDGRREQDRLQSNLAAADSQVIELKDQLNNANLLVDGLSKLKGADEIMGAEAAQAHSAVQQPKAPATSMKNPSDSSAKDPKKQLWAVGFTFASLASLFLLIVLAGSNTGASGFFVFLVFAVLVVAAGYTFKRATSA
jgi:chromosome segregation ATPase